MVDSIQILEDRVTALEKQVYGTNKTFVTDGKLPETSVIESLMSINVFISSALSGRDNTNTLMNRLSELNSYLDTHFEECDLQTNAKLEFILAMEYKIKENLGLLTEMQQLMPLLETDRIRDVPELFKKLNIITLNYLKMNDELKILTDGIHDLFTKYNSIITSISESLIAMDASITNAEIAAAPRKPRE